MIRLEPVRTAGQVRAFHQLYKDVYREYPAHRATDEEVAHLVLGGDSVFVRRARVEPNLVMEGDRPVARFAFLQDQKRPEYAQLAFFEALPGLSGQELLGVILPRARQLFRDSRTLVAGLNAHLNYSAGFLADRFDEPPVFGLPYTPRYYLDYFPGMKRRDMHSFRVPTRPFYGKLVAPRNSPITVRTMDRRQLRREVGLYTFLNNACFQQHPYWADRTEDEDFELFNPFRFFIDDQHLLFAEAGGRPVGFLLWYPDFNELADHGETLGPKHLLKYRVLRRRPRTFRLTEVAVVDEYRSKGVIPALFAKLTELAEQGGYEQFEGGFIFEENADCIAATVHSIARVLGKEPAPYRRYCVFEAPL